MRTSAFGTKRTSPWRPTISAFGGKADIAQRIISRPFGLARSETFPLFSILALFLLLGRSRVIVSQALLLRPLSRSAPLPVLRLVAAATNHNRHQTTDVGDLFSRSIKRFRGYSSPLLCTSVWPVRIVRRTGPLRTSRKSLYTWRVCTALQQRAQLHEHT